MVQQTDNLLKIIGTSHIAQESLDAIKKEFFAFAPDIIGVELDRQRLHALINKTKTTYSPKLIRHIGVKGYLFAVIGGFLQKKLGRIVNMEPGSDMLQAVHLAQNNNVKLLLLDQNITHTLSQLKFTHKERWRLFVDLFFGWTKKNKRVKIHLDKIPSSKLIEQLIKELKKRYPSLYKTLVHDRNVFMAKRLAHVRKDYPDKKILLVVGAGHTKGLYKEYVRFLKEQIKEAHND